MAFSFKLDEPPQKELRRLAKSQVTKVLNLLDSGPHSETTIHESRKTLKRLKTLFKLVRPGLSRSIYEHEYAVIRDAARALSGVRDRDVMPATLAGLRAADGMIPDAVLIEIEKALAPRPESPDDRADPSARLPEVPEVIAALQAARARYKELELTDNDFQMLAIGAAKCLRKLQRQYKIAVSSSDDEDYHEWRKSAQLHWRQLRLLSEAWPEMLAARISVARELAAVLGDDHDLSVLAGFVEGLPRSQLKSGQKKTVLTAVRDRQQALREKARACAAFIVLDDPDNFADRLSACHAARRLLGHTPGSVANAPGSGDGACE